MAPFRFSMILVAALTAVGSLHAQNADYVVEPGAKIPLNLI